MRIVRIVRNVRNVCSLAALLLLGGCVSMPSGPGVMVLPGTGKSFDQFRADDMECRQFAGNQVGGSTPDSAAEASGLKSAAVGAAAGAIIGGRSGAATGAGTGPDHRRRGGRGRGRQLAAHAAAALRLRLPAVHVRQGSQDPERGTLREHLVAPPGLRVYAAAAPCRNSAAAAPPARSDGRRLQADGRAAESSGYMGRRTRLNFSCE